MKSISFCLQFSLASNGQFIPTLHTAYHDMGFVQATASQNNSLGRGSHRWNQRGSNDNLETAHHRRAACGVQRTRTAPAWPAPHLSFVLPPRTLRVPSSSPPSRVGVVYVEGREVTHKKKKAPPDHVLSSIVDFVVVKPGLAALLA